MDETDDERALAAELLAVYRDLHAHPELAFQEVRTATKVADRLRALGYAVQTHIGKTGVVGVLENGNGPVVLLRADLDGLPVLEQTGLPYASTVRARDAGGADVPVMHACGHDVHLTCLLGAAELLARSRQGWSGTVVALFQPAEEAAGGAAAMVADGLFERIPRPEVVLGQHVMPMPVETVGLRAGPFMAFSDRLRIVVHGRGGHASRPETTVDAVHLAAHVVVRLQGIVTREIAAHDAAVVTVGSLTAGAKANILPDTAELNVSVRTLDESVRESVLAAVERVVRAECAASAAPRPPEFFHEQRYPMTVNDAGATERVAAAFARDLAGVRVIDPGSVMLSEDVSELSSAADAALVYWFIGGFESATARSFDFRRPPAELPSNHSPRFAPAAERTIGLGTRTLTSAAREWLGPR